VRSRADGEDAGVSETTRPRQIVALGSTPRQVEAIGPLVDYLLGLTGKARPKVCFLPTAKGDQPEVIVAMYERVPGSAAERSHLALFDRTVDDIGAFLLSQDLIWVGGGNTANMLAVWRVHGVDRALRDAWEAGVVLCGGSAGCLCWFEGGTTDSFGAALAPLNDGLRFLAGSACPHYAAPSRRPLYHRLIAEGMPAGYGIEDDAGIRFVGTDLAEAVSAREGAAVYRVELRAGQVVETALPARRLG
jgi:peptidase E